jgi:hypothetical protein
MCCYWEYGVKFLQIIFSNRWLFIFWLLFIIYLWDKPGLSYIMWSEEHYIKKILKSPNLFQDIKFFLKNLLHLYLIVKQDSFTCISEAINSL